MLKAVLFDMDGVLIDSEPHYMVMEVALAHENGFPLTEEEQMKYRGSYMTVLWQDLIDKYGSDKTPEFFCEERKKRVRAIYASKAQPITKMINVMKGLYEAGLIIVVATSTDRDNADICLERINIKKYLSGVITGDMVKKSKPNPEIFLLAARKAGVKPDECLVIEDSPFGVAGGKAAKIKVIGYNEARLLDLSAADLVVTDASQITLQAAKNLCK